MPRTDQAPEIARASLGFRREADMLRPALDAAHHWWGARMPPTVFANEVVGPDAIADVVAVRLGHEAALARHSAGIHPVVDRLAVAAVLQARRVARTTADLAALCRVGLSGMRRAVALAIDAGALVREGRRHVRAHPAWTPATSRIVAVELKRDNALAALDQAGAYARWANVAWVVLGRFPSERAIEEARIRGVGMAMLEVNGTWCTIARPRPQRRPQDPWAAAWAAEQALASGSWLPAAAAIRRQS